VSKTSIWPEVYFPDLKASREEKELAIKILGHYGGLSVHPRIGNGKPIPKKSVVNGKGGPSVLQIDTGSGPDL